MNPKSLPDWLTFKRPFLAQFITTVYTEAISHCPNKAVVDQKELQLMALSYHRVAPHSKLGPRQYWRDENRLDANLNPCEPNYSIEWWNTRGT
jgi:hypothetical protein